MESTRSIKHITVGDILYRGCQAVDGYGYYSYKVLGVVDTTLLLQCLICNKDVVFIAKKESDAFSIVSIIIDGEAASLYGEFNLHATAHKKDTPLVPSLTKAKQIYLSRSLDESEKELEDTEQLLQKLRNTKISIIKKIDSLKLQFADTLKQ